MAQSIAYYQNKMLDQIAADPILSGLNSPSQVAIYRLLTYVVATCLNLFDQTLDIFKSEVDSIAAEAVPGTEQWVQNQVFLFQYSATNPQVVELVNFAPTYPVVDTDLQIITRCSVKTLTNRVVSIKTAKQEPPIALTTLELNALISYMDTIGFAGVQPDIISLNPDRLFLEADIYYNGAYSPVISDNVIAAINQFLSDFTNEDFDGTIRVTKLTDAILAVAGVTDVAINNLAMRADTTSFGSKTYLVQGYDLLLTKYPTFAGYIIEEDTVGETFTDKLNFIVE